MKKTSAILVLSAVLLDGSTQVSFEDNLVLVESSSTIPVMPDAVLLRFNLEITDSSGIAVLAKANQRIKEIEKALRKAGFDEPCAMGDQCINITSYPWDSYTEHGIDPPGFFLLVEPHRADGAVDVLEKLSSKDRSLNILCNDIRFVARDVASSIPGLREQAFAQVRRYAEKAVLSEGLQMGKLLASWEKHPPQFSTIEWSRHTEYHIGGPDIDVSKPLSPVWLGFGLKAAFALSDSAKGLTEFFKDADVIPTVAFNRSEITARGQSSLLVVPDAASLRFELTVWDEIEDSVEVFAKTNQFYAEIRQALAKNGIRSLATLDDAYYMTPGTHYGGESLRIDHGLYLTLNDPSQADLAIKVVESMSEPDEGKRAFIGWVEYKITDMESYLPRLRKMALKDARARAEEAAGFYACNLGDIKGWHEVGITPGGSGGHHRQWDVASEDGNLPRMWVNYAIQVTYKTTSKEAK